MLRPSVEVEELNTALLAVHLLAWNEVGWCYVRCRWFRHKTRYHLHNVSPYADEIVEHARLVHESNRLLRKFPAQRLQNPLVDLGCSALAGSSAPTAEPAVGSV